MADVGLLAEGFVPDTIPNIRGGMEEGMRGQFSRSMPLGNRTLLGYMIGAISERLGLLWEIAELCFKMMDPDQARGAYLEALCALTATFRAFAEMSTVLLTLCGDDATLVTAGNVITTESTGKNFNTFADATIELLDDWVLTTHYDVDDRVTNSSRCYQCTVAGTSAGSGGPTTTATSIVDGGVTWTYLGEGTAAVDVIATSEDEGPVIAVARDLSVISTPVGGWNTATNLADATPGRDDMADEELRLLREEELAVDGTSTPDAIHAAIRKLDGVTHVTVFFNDDEETVGNLPPHSCEILVQGGDDQTIVDALWANVPIGITTIGTSAGIAIDIEGNEQPINYSRPEIVDAYLYLTIKTLPKGYGGDAAVKLAVKTFTLAELGAGDDIEPSELGAQAFAAGGVKKLVEARAYTDVIAAGAPWTIGTVYSATPGARSVVTNKGRSYICITAGTSLGSGIGPVGDEQDITDNTVHWRFLGASLALTDRQLALYDTSRMIVVSSPEAP